MLIPKLQSVFFLACQVFSPQLPLQISQITLFLLVEICQLITIGLISSNLLVKSHDEVRAAANRCFAIHTQTLVENSCQTSV